MWAVHRFLDRVSGGRLRTDRVYKPTLWLTTVGRKSGTVRENALIYISDGPNLVVVASNAVAARIASKAEAAELWPRLDRVNPTYADYRKMTARPISIVILEPPR